MSLNQSHVLHSQCDNVESTKKPIQPVRIKEILDMYENDDDDSDNKNEDSDEENELKDLLPLSKCNSPSKIQQSQTKTDHFADASQSKVDDVDLSISNHVASHCSLKEPWRKSSASKELFQSKIAQKVKKQCKNEFSSDFSKINIGELKSENTGLKETPTLSQILNVPVSAFENDNSYSNCKTPMVSESYITTHSKMCYGPSDMLHATFDKHLSGRTSYNEESNTTVGKYCQYNESANVIAAGIANPSETPHKHHHPPVEQLRPVSSMSRRTIFQTPQTKISTDLPTNPKETPSSIFAAWRQSHPTMHTPMQSNIKEDIHTSGQSLGPQQAVPWHKGERKSFRRPLMDTTVPERRTMIKDYEQALPINDIDVVENKQQSILKTIYEKHVASPIHRELNENLHPSVIPPTTQSNEFGTTLQVGKNALVHRSQINHHISTPLVSPPSYYGKKIIVKQNEYIILGSLGKGMSGEVYRVQDLFNYELKAIKYVNLALLDRECAQSCINEVKMLHKLQAPTVVKMFDYEIKDQSLCVVMEMGDTDLSRFLKSVSSEKKKLPLTMILYYWTEMLTAVKHIHDNGVIHSDLKPGNFLFVQGRLKLIDFGISSSLNGEMTSVVKNTSVGTLNYLSPEALMDTGGGGDSPNRPTKYKISYKSDVWSLGCILYSLVFGSTPFHNIRTHWAKVSAITNPKYEICFTLPPNTEYIPTILINVIKACLQHDPKRRPSVDQLLQTQYFSMAKNSPSIPDIPLSILQKIEHSLEEEEWRVFSEVWEHLRNH